MLLQEIATHPNLVKSKTKLLVFDATPKASLKPIPERRQGWKRVLEIFGKNTTIHGVNWLCARGANRRERLVWSLVLLSAVSVLIYVCMLVATRYNAKQLQTVIDSTKYPVYKVPFPEVTICNNNRLNWARLAEAKQRYLAPDHMTGVHGQIFENILTGYDSLTYGRFDVFEDLPGVAVLESLNYINFSSVVHFMAWRCDELFEDCVWQRHQFNCCEIVFPRISQMGVCLAFNSIESKQGKLKQLMDPKWPWRVGKYGPGSGLTVRLQLREYLHSPHKRNQKGITFMLAETYVWYSEPMKVAAMSQAKTSIRGAINIRDNETRSVPAGLRGCVFENEHGDHHFKKLSGYDEYMFENCESECQQESLVHYCNCTMDIFFPPSAYPRCLAEDLPCLAQYNSRLQHFDRSGEDEYVKQTNFTGIQCTCLLKCKLSLRFMPTTVISALEMGKEYANRSFVELDIYFHNSFMFVYKTTLVFTWVNLLVYFGGLAALFLGCSLISLVELIYFSLKYIFKW